MNKAMTNVRSYFKLVLNRLKVLGGLIFIYTSMGI